MECGDPQAQSARQSAADSSSVLISSRSGASIFTRIVFLLVAAVSAAALFLWISQPAVTAVPPGPPGKASQDVTELLRQLHESASLKVDSADAWGDYGMALMQHEFHSEALQCLAVAECLAPEDPRWPYLQGVILEQSSAERAKQAFERTLSLRPSSVPTVLRSSSAQISLGQYQQATARIRQLLQEQPQQQQGWLLLLQLHRLEHSQQSAAGLLVQAREAGAETRELLQEAARLALQQEDPETAGILADAAQQAQPISPMSDPWMDMVRTYDASGTITAIEADRLRSRGQQDAAAEKLAALVRAQPDRSRPALNLALTLQESGQLDAAELQLAELSRSFPDDPMILFHYAVLLSQTAKPGPAMTQLERCLNLKPDYGLARSLQALLLSDDGQTEAAAAEFRRAIQDTPASIPVRLLFLEFLQQHSRTTEFELLLLDSAPLLLSDAADADPTLQSYRQQLLELQSDTAAGRHEPDNAPEQDNE